MSEVLLGSPTASALTHSDDIVQDVFEAVDDSSNRFDARRGSLLTYLKMAARTRHLDGRAQRQAGAVAKRPASDLTSLLLPAEMEGLKALSKLQMQLALAALPQQERVAIELSYFGDLTNRSVAEQLGLPEGTVKGRIRKWSRPSPNVGRAFLGRPSMQSDAPLNNPGETGELAAEASGFLARWPTLIPALRLWPC
jgi:RNA polymerase sigma factor (sigma-70 family)